MGVGRGYGVERVVRSSYPSGPTTVERLPAHRPVLPVAAPPVADPPNPDPRNFRFERVEEVGPYLVVKIHYPDCTNYEGRKIIVYRGLSLLDLVNQRVIDPHFFEGGPAASPTARFVPTDEGWEMAVCFARMMTVGGPAAPSAG